ncbi:MAG: flagellar protein export ATPase FliI [Burkholderiales bacterium]
MGHIERWCDFLQDCGELAGSVSPWAVTGRLTRVGGLVMEAVGLKLPVGSECIVSMPNGHSVTAEVVGFSGERLFLMPTTDVYGLAPGAKVTPAFSTALPELSSRLSVVPRRRAEDCTKLVGVGTALLGRVMDGAGRPLDQRDMPLFEQKVPLQSRPINPLSRAPIRHALDVGVRAINALLTVGRGQRMGLFSSSGIGKSVLLGMMARYTDADVIVVGLIGERGREVKDFIENILGDEGLARAVVIAAPADTPPLLRIHGVAYATAVAEYFRDQGKHVLLIMDSLTRYAMALREVGLAIGEPPATKGYPPSVFAKVPQLVERAGNGHEGGGSITAFYTVLVEGDEQQDPVGECARAVLDGHIVLSRALAEQGHYPAIDIEASISRAISELLKPHQLDLVRRFKSLYSRYQRSRDLITVGAYTKGNDPALDEAIALYPRLEQFLQQDTYVALNYDISRNQLVALLDR